MDLATKLQIKPDVTVFLVAAPDGFDLSDRTRSRTAASAGAVLGFVTRRSDIARSRQVLAAAASDRVAWLAYPKGGQLGTDINRDLLSADVAEWGLDTVRQIALDDTWSALRLRPTSR